MTIDELLRSAYSRMRSREISNDTRTSTLLALAVRKSADLIRGNLLGWKYLHGARTHFRGRFVQIRGQNQLTLGHAVMFDDHVRIDASSSQGIRLSDRVTVGRFAMISGNGVIAEPGIGVTVGSDTSIGTHNVIWGQGGVTIGNDCLLGPGVTIISENHGYANEKVPIRTQPGERSPITIQDDCWLGSNVTVLAGVSIGKGSVIAAGAVVTKNLPPYSIAAGIPARIIGAR